MKSGRVRAADARGNEQRAEAKVIKQQNPKWLAWKVATRLSEARHDEAERKFAADEEKREKYVRGWGVRTIYENIAGLFPVKL